MGEVDVDAMLYRMTREQFREWQAYYQIQPFGDQRADIRAATVAQSMAGGELTDYMQFLEE